MGRVIAYKEISRRTRSVLLENMLSYGIIHGYDDGGIIEPVDQIIFRSHGNDIILKRIE